MKEQIELPIGQSFRFLRWLGDCREVKVVVSPRELRPVRWEGTHWHYHLEMELALFETAEGTRYVGDHIGGFRGRDFVLIGENLPHFWEVTGRCSGCAVQWHFPPRHPIWNLPEMNGLAAFFADARQGIRFFGRTAETLGSQLQELQDYQGLDRLGLFLRLLHRLSASPKTDQELLSKRTFSLASESQYEVAMRDAVRHIVSNFSEEVHLPDLLRKLGMTKPTFSRQFRKHSGKTFTQFVQQVRLEAACKQLRETDTPVVKIAFNCGFTQISFFNRLFRRHCRLSPLAYRRKHQAQTPSAGIAQLPFLGLSGGAGWS